MREPEDLVAEVWARWNGGERAFDPEISDPDLEIHSQMTRTVYRGAEESARWMKEIDQQFDSWQLRIDEQRRLDEHTVLVSGRIHARARHSGIELDEPAAWVVTVRAGRLLKIVNSIGQAEVDATVADAG
jgi:hypothetical protein